MWSHLLRALVFAAWIPTSAMAGGRTEASRLQIVVSVFNRSEAEHAVILASEKMTTKIYEQIGVSIVWKNCRTQSEPDLDRCEPATDRTQLVLHIEHQSRALFTDAFGVSWLGDDGWGRYCDVFYDRILMLHREGRASEGTILGMVVAHELGHLLLGSNSHSDSGIMRPKWQSQDFLTPEFGVTKFSRNQVQKIYDRFKQVAPIEVARR